MSDYLNFRAIKSAVSLKDGDRVAVKHVHVDFRAIKSAVSLKGINWTTER